MTNGIRQPPRPPPAHHPAQPPPPARPGHPPALHQGGEPGAREAQAEPEPAPSSPQAVNAQQRPAGARGEPAARGRKAKPAPSRGGEDARPAGERQPYPAQGTGNTCAHAEPAPSQTPEPAPPPAPRKPTIWRGREERGEERGSAQKITALQHRPAPAPDEATAQALHPCRQPSQHPRPDGQPWRAPSIRGFNSAFVEYAELPLTNAAHAIPGEARQGGTVYILTGKIVAKISPCTPFSTPLNLSPKQIPYITTLFIVLFFALKIIRERVRLNRLIIAYFFGIKISFNIS